MDIHRPWRIKGEESRDGGNPNVAASRWISWLYGLRLWTSMTTLPLSILAYGAIAEKN